MKRCWFVFFLVIFCSHTRICHAQGDPPFSIGGRVSVLAGWQHDSGTVTNTNLGGLGPYIGALGPDKNSVDFILDEVQLEIASEKKNKVRGLADLKFGAPASGSQYTIFVQQAYVGFTLPVGNGIETTVGSFVAPFGFEDTAHPSSNISVTLAPASFPTPTGVTGVMFYYPFSDHLDFNLYIVNNLRDDLTGDVITPSFGSRLELHSVSNKSSDAVSNKKDESADNDDEPENYVALNFAAGPETPGHSAHWTFMNDIEFSVNITPRLLLGGEAYYIQNNGVPPAPNLKSTTLLLLGQYTFENDFYLFAKYNLLVGKGPQSPLTAVKQTINSFSTGFGYPIVEGALVKGEFRADIDRPKGLEQFAIYSTVVNFVYFLPSKNH